MSYPGTTTPTAGAVKRALAILECLDSSRRGLNISEISRRLTIPKSSTHVIVRTLEHLGYVEREAGGVHYSLGTRAHVLGTGIMTTLDLASAAQPHMARLAESLRASVHLAVPDRDQGVFIQKIDAPGVAKFDTHVGRRLDLHCTAVGKVILAYGPAEVRERAAARQEYGGGMNGNSSPTVLVRELKRVRKSGYACDGEEDDVQCLAVPVLTRSGRFLAALGVTAMANRIPVTAVDDIAGVCKETAAAIAAVRSSEGREQLQNS